MPGPQSSTHCELVALTLVSRIQSLVLTDSLSALHLIAFWGRWSARTTFSRPDHTVVRHFLSLWTGTPPPMFEKMKAHDDAAVSAGSVKAMGNADVETLATQAASPSVEPYSSDPRFADAVQFYTLSVISAPFSTLCRSLS